MLVFVSCEVSLVCRVYSMPPPPPFNDLFPFFHTLPKLTKPYSFSMRFPLSFSNYKMELQRRLIVLVFLALVVSGYKENSTTTPPVSVHDQLQYSSRNLEAKQKVNEEKKRLRHHYSFEAFFANKRKVPNASDPLHNR
ncbi:hypothetical protein RchiOBHm_Chr6g0308941 [Rosa chinensis]|uniref:CLAVATA3/ESR (CLE)-related protein n=1 Tax=Rosa chinensis TaxID=74649 RepID=A0A2P6Q0S5_ROSCH|nr:hypothetical protein RchiOBHm_Chr6g0308941 [Rosa chinensis]